MPKTTSDMHGDRESIAALASDADTLNRERESQLAALLDRLDALDPQLVHRIIETLSDRHRAALWLARTSQGLGGISPYRALANGQRQAVLDVLGRIEHGVLG